ncbi:MAG: TerD family protein [Deltaproteobacteria bacterium]|nr:TerD family protein [Deltaproteobacteria bacterium]
MQQLTRGQKGKLADLGSPDRVDIAVSLAPPGSQVIDVSCFGLDEKGQLSNDQYFVFFNQKRSPEGAIEMVGARHGAGECFSLDLSRLPSTIKKLVFTAAIDGEGTMGGLGECRVDVVVSGNSAARYSFSGKDFGAEKALMLFEVYHKDVWRFSPVGQGFNGGLSALLKNFGGEEIAPAAPAPAVPQPAPASPPPKVNLGKVTLDKKGSKGTVNLKKGGGLQPIHVNLNWDNPNAGKKTGLFGLGGQAPAPDLDLGCMFLMANGDMGVIQPLGDRMGSRHSSPYIYLDKDDRTGAASDGENLYILRPDLIEKVMVFALVYEGAANFATVNGRLTLKDGNQEIFIPLNSPDARRTFCSICLIQRKGENVEITKEERYFMGHQDADEHYGFGFRWVAGRK